MKKLALSASVLLLSAPAALAQIIDAKDPAAVPEISALEGVAALALVAAVVAVVWERRRRAA